MTQLISGICAVALLSGLAFSQDAATLSPQAAVEGLLAADRAFSAASARTDLVAGISAMFTADVTMPIPGNTFAVGKTKAVEALQGNADNLKSRAEWVPIRGGVSADGQHGFTYGYMTLRNLDTNTTAPLKYLAYWVKRPEGWRVAAYRRGRRPEGTVSLDPVPPSLPARMVPPVKDAATIAKFKQSLEEAENSFSKEAQSMGLGPAFAKHGSADAVNMGGPSSPAFVVGSEAIGRAVGQGEPAGTSPVSWGADRSLVASSGDLGITFGLIRPHAPAAGQPPAIPFFTIWRRATPADPWRYIAE